MQRYNLNLKGGSYTAGTTYTLMPILRQQVVPGQTVNMEVQVSLKTAAFTQNVSTPCLMSTWFFYVPHRISWDGWTDFISKQEGAGAMPKAAPSSLFLEHLATGSALSSPCSTLYRRAYKNIYNEYFGSESVGASKFAWYDDVNDDTIASPYRTVSPEQFTSRIQLEGSVVDPEFTVTASSIPLNDFYRQMMNARSTQRSQMTGDKYVDTLARMGVDATWMIAERPEFLGTKSQLVAPHITANTSDTNTGEEAARFDTRLTCQLKSKHFAEHGYIVGVCSVRPILIDQHRGSPDQLKTDIDDFYSADNLDTKDDVIADSNGFTGTDAYTQRFGYLRNGAWIRGKNTSWVIDSSPANFGELLYPNVSTLPVGTELGGDQFAATCSYSMSGKTPVPTRVA
jgi:hypothetical protein